MPVLTETTARWIIYNIVVDWISQHTGIPRAHIEIHQPLSHYGVTEGAYLTLCNWVTTSANRTTGRAMVLRGQWRLDHASDIIAVYIDAVAQQLLASAPTQVGRAAMSFAKEFGAIEKKNTTKSRSKKNKI